MAIDSPPRIMKAHESHSRIPAELRSVKKEMAVLNKKLIALQKRKKELETAFGG